MRPSLAWLRTRGVWLLLVPFLALARPTPILLFWGALLALAGLALRAWAAGVIRKSRELTTHGPYAYSRNPLYLGSLLLGGGVVLAGGRWFFQLLFLLFFAVVYGRTIKREEAHLKARFGERYREYAARVPPLLPRLTPYRTSDGPEGSAFSITRYRGNREYEALLGATAGFAFLIAKMLWM